MSVEEEECECERGKVEGVECGGRHRVVCV